MEKDKGIRKVDKDTKNNIQASLQTEENKSFQSQVQMTIIPQLKPNRYIFRSNFDKIL